MYSRDPICHSNGRSNIYIQQIEFIHLDRSRGTARYEGSVRAGVRMGWGHIEYRDEEISDDCLRDYICGIVPMEE